jgi:AraC family transcriptional regulator, transcriptional activator of pobA
MRQSRPDIDTIRLVTLAQLMLEGRWQLELAHDRDESLLIWITRGQGLALLDGARRGIGTHNVLFVPPHQLMALDLGRQGYGQALVLPAATRLPLPEKPHHLRIRDAGAQAELAGLLEALGREQNARRAMVQSAMAAYGDLCMIWLHRQIARPEQAQPRASAARRLSRAFCARIAGAYSFGAITGARAGTSMAGHAAALGVTPTHLTRVSKAQTGKTAATLLTERQVHAARQLLIATDVPVQDIARHLGFGSAAYFTRFVQQHTGKPPTVLRRSARSAAAVPGRAGAVQPAR